MSGGTSSPVSYFRTPADDPQRISRTGSIVPPSWRFFATGATRLGSVDAIAGSRGEVGVNVP